MVHYGVGDGREDRCSLYVTAHCLPFRMLVVKNVNI